MKSYEFVISPEKLVNFTNLLTSYGFEDVHNTSPNRDPYTGTLTVTVYGVGSEQAYKKVMDILWRD